MPTSWAIVNRRRAVSDDGAEIRRTCGRRLVAPLIAASLILCGEIASLRGSGDADVPLRATPEPAIDAPAFVRPPKPAPDVLIGQKIRIG